MRGPGEFIGSRQSAVPLLRFADLALDEPLLVAARETAERLLRDQAVVVEAHLHRWLSGRSELLLS